MRFRRGGVDKRLDYSVVAAPLGRFGLGLPRLPTIRCQPQPSSLHDLGAADHRLVASCFLPERI